MGSPKICRRLQLVSSTTMLIRTWLVLVLSSSASAKRAATPTQTGVPPTSSPLTPTPPTVAPPTAGPNPPVAPTATPPTAKPPTPAPTMPTPAPTTANITTSTPSSAWTDEPMTETPMPPTAAPTLVPATLEPPTPVPAGEEVVLCFDPSKTQCPLHDRYDFCDFTSAYLAHVMAAFQVDLSLRTASGLDMSDLVDIDFGRCRSNDALCGVGGACAVHAKLRYHAIDSTTQALLVKCSKEPRHCLELEAAGLSAPAMEVATAPPNGEESSALPVWVLAAVGALFLFCFVAGLVWVRRRRGAVSEAEAAAAMHAAVENHNGDIELFEDTEGDASKASKTISITALSAEARRKSEDAPLFNRSSPAALDMTTDMLGLSRSSRPHAVHNMTHGYGHDAADASSRLNESLFLGHTMRRPPRARSPCQATNPPRRPNPAKPADNANFSITQM